MAKRKKREMIITQQEWLGVYTQTAQGLAGTVEVASVEDDDVDDIANAIDNIAMAVADLAADALEERFGAGGGKENEDEEEDD